MTPKKRKPSKSSPSSEKKWPKKKQNSEKSTQSTTSSKPKTPHTRSKIAVGDKHVIIRDTREQEGHGWTFEETEIISGTIVKTVKYGDYTVQGYETLFTIERKRNVAEFAKNILEDRFERELQALENIKYSYVIMEFTLADIMRWPASSGLAMSIQRRIRTSPAFILKRLSEYEVKYKTKFIFAGMFGKEMCLSILRAFLAEQKQNQDLDISLDLEGDSLCLS